MMKMGVWLEWDDMYYTIYLDPLYPGDKILTDVLYILDNSAEAHSIYVL